MNSKASRREFLKTGIVGATAAGATIAGISQASGNETGTLQVDRRKLGKTGLEASMIGLGLGSAFTRSHGDDPDAAAEILEKALDLGINYWDTARAYGISEELMGPTVEKHREKILLVSKTGVRTYDGFKRELETSLKNLRTDYIDLYHIHSMDPEKDTDMAAVENGAARAAREAKDQGIIKHFGITGHSGAKVLIDTIKRIEPDCIMTIFPCSRPDDGKYEDELLPLAIEKNMGIVAMKTVRYARDADLKGTDLIRYALSLPGVAVANVGLDSIAHLTENAAMVTSFEPLSQADRVALHRKVTPALAGLVAPWDRPGYKDGMYA